MKDQYARGLLTVDFQAMLDMKTCPECKGTKLKKESLNVFLTFKSKAKDKTPGKYNIADLQKMPLNGLVEFIDLYKEHTTKDKTLVERIVNPLIDRAKTIQDL